MPMRFWYSIGSKDDLLSESVGSIPKPIIHILSPNNIIYKKDVSPTSFLLVESPWMKFTPFIGLAIIMILLLLS